jgi:hypothetical protein
MEYFSPPESVAWLRHFEQQGVPQCCWTCKHCHPHFRFTGAAPARCAVYQTDIPEEGTAVLGECPSWEYGETPADDEPPF